MQAEAFWRASSPLQSLVLPLLTSYRTVRLLNHVVAACATDHLLVVDINQVRKLLDRGSIAPQLAGTDGVWDIVFAEEIAQNDLRGFGLPVALKENIEHETVLVDRPRASVGRHLPSCKPHPKATPNPGVPSR